MVLQVHAVECYVPPQYAVPYQVTLKKFESISQKLMEWLSVGSEATGRDNQLVTIDAIKIDNFIDDHNPILWITLS